MWHWLNTSAGAIQAIASILNFLALAASVVITILLVHYTRRYVGLTQKLAETANAELLSREESRKAHRHELESVVRSLLVTREPLEVYGTPGVETLERTLRSSKGLDWADFERFTILAAEVDGDTARQAQVLKRDLSWLNHRIKEVRSHRPGLATSLGPGSRTAARANGTTLLLVRETR